MYPPRAKAQPLWAGCSPPSGFYADGQNLPPGDGEAHHSHRLAGLHCGDFHILVNPHTVLLFIGRAKHTLDEVRWFAGIAVNAPCTLSATEGPFDAAPDGCIGCGGDFLAFFVQRFSVLSPLAA